MGGVLEGLKCIPIERVGHSSGLPFKFWKQTAAPHKIYFFRQITTFIKLCVVFVFGLQILWTIDFTKIFQLKVLKPKIKGHMNFYECCDLTKKYFYEPLMWQHQHRRECRLYMITILVTLWWLAYLAFGISFRLVTSH